MGWQGYGPWRFTLHKEPLLSNELARLAGAKTLHGVDCVSIQPCPNPEECSQDRYTIEEWATGIAKFKFVAVYDGHAGPELADYTANTLSGHIRSALDDMLSNGRYPDVDEISRMFVNVISSFDNSIIQTLYAQLPNGDNAEALNRLTDEDIFNLTGYPSTKPEITRCTRGTTALVALFELERKDLWVASLGDSTAVLGYQSSAGHIVSEILSANHNGANPVEAEKIRTAHPGEPECVMNNRVLGAIAVTRAIGDFYFKIPSEFAHRILSRVSPPRIMSKFEDFLPRNLTPPYLSNVPEVAYINVEGKEDVILVLCSDGLTDLYMDAGTTGSDFADRVIRVALGSGSPNRAQGILRDALGGDDIEKVSRMLTVEMIGRWMDDTTVLVFKP